MPENKQRILDFLLSAIQNTNAGETLLYLKISDDERTVTAEYEGGYTEEINVHMDNGIAMIRDVVKQLDL